MDKRGLIESVIALVLAAVVAVSLLSFTNTYLATDTPQVAVTTGSMLPVYNGYQDTGNAPVHPFRGDLLIIKGESEYKVGDVIVFDDPRGVTKIPIVHRIIDVKVESGQVFYRTKGDNNQIADPFWVPKDNVHGKVILRIPHVGWLSLLLRTDPYRYVLILLIGVIILFSAFRDDSEEDDDDAKEKNKSNDDDDDEKHEGSRIGASNQDDMSVAVGETETSKMKTSESSRVAVSQSIQVLGNPETFKTLLSRSLRNGYVIMILIVFWLYLVGNAATLAFMDNDVLLTNLDGTPLDGQAFNRNEPGVYYLRNASGMQVYGIYTSVTIISSGFFDWVQRIDFTTSSSSGLKKTVTWTIVYAWSGEKTIDWLILVAFPDNLDLSSVTETPIPITLEITLYSSGPLSASPITKTLTFYFQP